MITCRQGIKKKKKKIIELETNFEFCYGPPENNWENWVITFFVWCIGKYQIFKKKHTQGKFEDGIRIILSFMDVAAQN